MIEISKIMLQHKRICKLVSGRRIRQSLSILYELVGHSGSAGFRDELHDLSATYRSMLKYTIEGVDDPEKHKVYTKMQQSILKLADRVKQDILSYNSGWNTYSLRADINREQRLTGRTIVESVDDLMFKTELDEWLQLSGEITPNPDSKLAREHKKLLNNIFNHLWLTDYYGEAEISLTSIIRKSGKFSWYEKSLFVSALTLSTLRVWDQKKLQILASIYLEGEEQVMERALAGFVLVLHQFDDRLPLYPDIRKIVDEMAENPQFREHCRLIVLQIIRSRETERLGKKLQDEILPQVAKLKPRIEEKLDLDNIVSSDNMEGKNPDWREMFEESEEVFKTMEELTNLQMEGADIYMSAFTHLKHFEFFKSIPNWFMPFYPDHEVVDVIFRDEILSDGTNDLAEALHKTPFICNSDKYSLLLNLTQLPASQKSMMLNVFKMELEGLEQMKYDERVSDPMSVFRTNMTMYLQDLYRFYKLSPHKQEFDDLFAGKLDLYNSEFFRIACGPEEAEAGLADYFFSKDYYDEALELFLKHALLRPDDGELCEKIGYCYQGLKKYDEALSYYKRAELISRKEWTLKKIAYCLRKSGKQAEALDYLIIAGDMAPDNMHTALVTGHCYLDLGDYEKALKHYFRVAYNDPENVKVLRPIAWCYFATGKLAESQEYYDRISSTPLSAHDMINMGHLALVSDQRKKAVGYYMQSMASGEITQESFTAIFYHDSDLLVKNGIHRDDIPILLDYLLFEADNPL